MLLTFFVVLFSFSGALPDHVSQPPAAAAGPPDLTRDPKPSAGSGPEVKGNGMRLR